MTMSANGLAKLIEECGELIQVAGKRLAYYRTDEHPDGGLPLTVRLEDEIADVMAACQLVIDAHVLDRPRIENRVRAKRNLFAQWHAADDNATDAIDAPPPSRHHHHWVTDDDGNVLDCACGLPWVANGPPIGGKL